MYGMMSVTGPKDGPPVKTGVALTDVITGYTMSCSLAPSMRSDKDFIFLVYMHMVLYSLLCVPVKPQGTGNTSIVV